MKYRMTKSKTTVKTASTIPERIRRRNRKDMARVLKYVLLMQRLSELRSLVKDDSTVDTRTRMSFQLAHC